jgi:hypothetical protein
MRKISHKIAACGFLVALTGCMWAIPRELATLPLLDDQQKIVLANWLAKHPTLRPASEVDCDCAADIQDMRRAGPSGQPMPNYEPYVVVGDFNGSGHTGFAIILISRTNAQSSVLAIFNGPFVSSDQPAAFVREEGEIAHRALFQTQEEHYLLVGPFWSEGCAFVPAGNTYKEECGEG